MSLVYQTRNKGSQRISAFYKRGPRVKNTVPPHPTSQNSKVPQESKVTLPAHSSAARAAFSRRQLLVETAGPFLLAEKAS